MTKHFQILFSKTLLKIVLTGLLGAVITSIVVLSSVPPVSRDALIHHLAIPKLYLKHGGIYEIPWAIFSYYPMNLDLLYVIPLYFGNDIIPKYIHFTFALLTAWLVFSYLRKRIDVYYGLLGALFFLSIPIIVKLSITAYVDLGLVFFSFAALFYFLKWIENRFRLRYLIISAISCGLALGTKYNGLIVFFLLTLFVPFIYSRFSREQGVPAYKGIGHSAAFFMLAFLIFSPWMIRNYIWTGNPVYPLYQTWLGSKKGDSDEHSIERLQKSSTVVAEKSKGPLGHFLIRKILFKESWWETAIIPIRIFFQGQDDNPKYFDGRLNPLLFIFPFFAFYRIKNNTSFLRAEKKVLLAFSVFYLFYTFLQTAIRIRYFAPIIPPLVILSVFGIYEIFSIINEHCSLQTRRIYMGLVILTLLVLMGMNAAYILNQFRHVDPISYITGRVGRDEYIERYRPEYSAIKYANDNIPNNSKLLCIFLGNRSYYGNSEMLFNYNLLFEAVKREGSPEKILLDLKKRGITHLIVRYGLMNKWSESEFDDRRKMILKEFFKDHVDMLFSGGGYGLYRLNF